MTWLGKLCEGEGDQLPKTRTISAVLLEMGFEQINDRRVKISKTGSYHYVWRRGCEDEAAKQIVKAFHNGKTLDENDPDWCPF